MKVSEKAVEKMPKSSVFRANLADAYRWAGQRDKAAAAYDEAITLALKVTEVNPRHAGALGILAICWSRKGDDARALQYISQARQIKPTDKELMYQEATIHALAGRNAQAAASLEEALRNGFSLQLAESDPELAELRKTPEFGRLAKELTLKSP